LANPSSSHLGDVSIRFAVDVGASGRVVGFDPSPEHVRIAEENAHRNQLEGIASFFALGISDHATSASTALDNAIDAGRRLQDGDPTTTIDQFCQGLGQIDYIKMDVEGSELAALRGSHQTIQRHKPKLAICVYHKRDDVWTIPNYIRKRYPFYRLYLDHHSLHDEETVLYAIKS
jgi:FkbM family methyltransferase